MMDSGMDFKMNNDAKSNGNFPRLTRAASKNFMTRVQSTSNSDWIQANPMGTEYAESHNNQSGNNE